MHLVWVIYGIADKLGDSKLKEPLIDALEHRYPPEVRAQAARALGIRPYQKGFTALIHALKDTDPTVRLQATIALGRSGDASVVPALLPMLTDADRFISFSARQALRRLDCWGDAREGLKSADPKLRLALLDAMETQYDSLAVGSLLQYAMEPDHPADERAKALTYAAEVHRKPQPWDGKWWGTRPATHGPREKVEEWVGTKTILEAVAMSLGDSQPPVRLAAIHAVVETKDRDALPKLRERFKAESELDVRKEIALALGKLEDKTALPMLVSTMKDAKAPEGLREAALTAVEAIGGESAVAALLDLLNRPDLPADRQPRVIAALGKSKSQTAIKPLVEKLDSDSASVKAASAEALAKIGKKVDTFAPKLRELLADKSVDVRKAAIDALATVKDRDAIPALVQAADKTETAFEASTALAAMPDLRALQIYLQGLTQRNGDLRKASASAITAIHDQAAPVLEKLAERHELNPAALPELVKIFAGNKPIMRWQVVGPFAVDAAPPFAVDKAIDAKASFPGIGDKMVSWKPARGDNKGMVDLNQVYKGSNDERSAFAYAEIRSPSSRKAEMLTGSDDTITVWLNGKEVTKHEGSRGWSFDADRFEVELAPGTNRIVVKCGNHGGLWQFSAAIGETSDYAFLKAAPSGAFNPDAYRKHALRAKGNPDKGKHLFADLKGLACVKCHAVGGEGGNVGPDLAGIASRYPKEELITSVLYPSAKIFSGYEPISVALTDGRVLVGIMKQDTADELEIQDAEAKRIKIPKADIEAKKVSDVSLMPNGLAEGLSQGDFADLISYLETLKEKPGEAKKP